MRKIIAPIKGSVELMGMKFSHISCDGTDTTVHLNGQSPQPAFCLPLRRFAEIYRGCQENPSANTPEVNGQVLDLGKDIASLVVRTHPAFIIM